MYIIFFLLSGFLGAELLDRIVNLCLTFKEMDKLLFIVAALFYIPTKVV